MKPKVLIFIDWFAPGYKAGGPTTSNVNIVDHLAGRFDFYVVTSDTDYHADAPYHDITPDCWTDRGNCHVWYCSKGKDGLQEIIRIAREADCPVWYVNGIYSRRFSIFPLIAARSVKPPKLVISPRGMLSPHTFTVKPHRKRLFLAAMKLSGLYRNAIIHGTNDAECEAACAIIGSHTSTAAIPNLPRKASASFALPSKPQGGIRLVSFARISPEKNTLYAIRALAKCRADVSLDLFGQINSDSYWQECLNEIAALPKNISVNHRGTAAPATIPALYREYDALFLPSTGENFGHAILEAFINGRPAIISDQTPWRNLRQKGVGADLPLASPSLFAETIDEMAATTSNDFADICRRAHKYAQEVCNNPKVIDNYIHLFTAETI